MRFRMVATDVDGTLVRSDGTLSARTKTALAIVEQSGATLVFVTGRPPRWMRPLVDATGHRGLAICANGALVFDLHTEKVVKENPLDGMVALEVAAALRAALPNVSFAIERQMRFGHEPAFPPRYPTPRDTLVATVEELLTAPVSKLLARHEGIDPDELLEVGRAVVGEIATVTHSSTGGLLEISGPGISKAYALEQLAHEQSIGSEQVIAFGDMPNDLPLLAWAGYAVAVANAHPEVLALADEVTTSNDDDGVAVVLEREFPARVTGGR